MATLTDVMKAEILRHTEAILRMAPIETGKISLTLEMNCASGEVGTIKIKPGYEVEVRRKT